MAMRPKSSSQISSTHGKLKLSTKYKYRTGNSGILNESDGSIYNKNKYDFENIPGKVKIKCFFREVCQINSLKMSPSNKPQKYLKKITLAIIIQNFVSVMTVPVEDIFVRCIRLNLI